MTIPVSPAPGSDPGQRQAGEFTDIRKGGLLDQLLPVSFRPYVELARLDRPIGTWLLLFPCWWSLAMAADRLPDLWLMLLFTIGAIVMRGAGCTVNDILDRKFDAQVERCRHRPIPSGRVTVWQAVAFLAAQLLVGLVILLQFNMTSIYLGVLSLVLVFTYPLMKRITWWPQAFLGLTFNWGALMGWAAVRDSVDLPALVLYAAGVAWTLGYDTIYAHQDKEDDVLIGVKSTALRFGDQSKLWISGFYLLTWLGIAIAGQLAGLGPMFLAVVTIGSFHLVWQVMTWQLDNQPDCLAKFRSNRFYGWIVLGAIVLGAVFKTTSFT